MKLNASEGNEPRKASSPLPFREAINKFVGNLSVKSYYITIMNEKRHEQQANMVIFKEKIRNILLPSKRSACL